MDQKTACPVCDKSFDNSMIEKHVEKCLFLSSFHTPTSPPLKKLKSDSNVSTVSKVEPAESIAEQSHEPRPSIKHAKDAPLAERMRPKTLDEYIGQCHVLGSNKFLRNLIETGNIPSMIFWGPPGCGKTSLANLISNICETNESLRFVKLSATMCGVNEVKEVVKIAKNEVKFKRKTILFMDEIHRFNKLQQDTFLPHIENGTIVLIGATTENPSFSLNSALLSRCRVIILHKLQVDNVMTILKRALQSNYRCILVDDLKKCKMKDHDFAIENKTLQWLAEISDGDARIALNSLQMAIDMKDQKTGTESKSTISLEDIKDSIKRSHLLYDRKGDEHYNIISAMHKSIRASDDNAALYWVTRMIEGGEDPLYIARRLVRIAGEDIGLADPQALNIAVSCMQGCQLIGMPECDVLLAECAVYLARTPKSTEVYRALLNCKKAISEHKGALPSVPLHLRNAPTKLMKNLDYGKGYNTLHKSQSGLKYLPDEMDNVSFFEK